MNRGVLPSGVGRSDMIGFKPHKDHFHMHYDCDTDTMYYTNFKYDSIMMTPSNPLSMAVIRKSWLYCTEQARKVKCSVLITVNGQTYTMDYESGFRVTKGHLGEDGESWLIYGRPITPYHLKWCINNRGTIGEANEAMRMSEDSISQWVKRFW